MKKLICLLLAMVMLVTVFVACDNKTPGGNEDESTTPDNGGDTNGDSEGSEEVTDAAPEVEIVVQGTPGHAEEFRMIVRANRYDYLYWPTNQTTDTVQRVVFERNSQIEEEFNVEFAIEEVNSTASDFKTAVETISAANNYDVVCWDYWWALEQTDGLFMDLSECDYINPEDKWWYQGWNKNITINNKQFSIVGDAALEVLQNLEVVFFNKDIAAAQGLDLYTTVEDGAWDIEEMMRINVQVSQNLDDDDTTNDYYGALYDVHSSQAALYSAGMKLTIIGEDGSISINQSQTGREEIIEAVDAVTALRHSREVKYSDTTARVTDYSIFTDQRALFYATCLLIGKDMKALGLPFEYGVLPAPKLNDEAEYISTTYGASVFSIPTKTADVERAQVVLNAMNAYSHIDVDEGLVYTFYELVIKGRVADEPADAKMIDLARNALYVDFAFINDISLNSSCCGAMHGNTSVSGSLSTAIRAAKTKLTSLMAPYT